MASLCASHEAEERFEETAWSVVIATSATTEPRAQAAMAELCGIYWRPIYAYLRRSGHPRHDAEDITQSFFQHLLENETLRRAAREKGRFRSFLLGVLKHCLVDEETRRHTLKRGGRIQFISTDELEAEELHHLRADHEAAPDEILDARWAGVVLERALDKVRAECAAEGKGDLFEALSPFLGGTRPHVSYQQVADRMKVGLGAVKTLIYRLRRRFATAVRREIMQTVSAPHEVDDELRRLRSVFARSREQAF
jgi:DNA-directed RNA polymerase specialized sigma24 family protein